MKFIKYIFPLLVLLPLTTFSQCRSYTKKKCVPSLEGYVQNENYNSAQLIPGDEAELLLTFYADKEYRLLVCSQPILPDVEFEVLDADEELIFSNKDSKNGEENLFDFKVATTQQLIVRLRVPETEGSNSMVHQGCVSIMVGSAE